MLRQVEKHEERLQVFINKLASLYQGVLYSIESIDRGELSNLNRAAFAKNAEDIKRSLEFFKDVYKVEPKQDDNLNPIGL